MWLSKQIMQQQELQDAATLGTVSIGGRHAAVVTDGEKYSGRDAAFDLTQGVEHTVASDKDGK